MTREQLGSVLNELNMEIVEIDEAKETVTVWNGKRAYRVFLQKLEGEDVSEVRELFEGKREEIMLDTYQRIVGYVSNTRGWNLSKLGELEARRVGEAFSTLPGEYLKDAELKKPSKVFVLEGHLGVSG